ncbi:hypothetical protein Tco_0387340 [Tanacetum coccineum]
MPPSVPEQKEFVNDVNRAAWNLMLLPAAQGCTLSLISLKCGKLVTKLGMLVEGYNPVEEIGAPVAKHMTLERLDIVSKRVMMWSRLESFGVVPMKSKEYVRSWKLFVCVKSVEKEQLRDVWRLCLLFRAEFLNVFPADLPGSSVPEKWTFVMIELVPGASCGACALSIAPSEMKELVSSCKKFVGNKDFIQERVHHRGTSLWHYEFQVYALWIDECRLCCIYGFDELGLEEKLYAKGVHRGPSNRLKQSKSLVCSKSPTDGLRSFRSAPILAIARRSEDFVCAHVMLHCKGYGVDIDELQENVEEGKSWKDAKSNFENSTQMDRNVWLYGGNPEIMKGDIANTIYRQGLTCAKLKASRTHMKPSGLCFSSQKFSEMDMGKSDIGFVSGLMITT